MHIIDLNNNEQIEEVKNMPLQDLCAHNLINLITDELEMEEFKKLFNKTPHLVNCLDPKGFHASMLKMACIFERLDIVQFLLSKGADPNIKHKDSDSCLFYMLSNKHVYVSAIIRENIIDALIKAGADINQIMTYGDPQEEAREEQSILHYALLVEKPELLLEALELGANTRLKCMGKTVLELAHKMNAPKYIDLINAFEDRKALEAGVKLDSKISLEKTKNKL